MESHFEKYKSSRIHYHVSIGGSADRVLICFHGYGESASSFSFLEERLSAEYTLIAIDFPFHGRTDWNEGLLFTTVDLESIIRSIKDRHSLSSAETCFLGFSMGGRVALSLLVHQEESVNKMVLVAPDGLKMNGWYWLATQTGIGNKLFSFLMKNPGLFFNSLRIINRTRIINQSIYKFMDNYVQNKQVRIELFSRWTTMRKFRPDQKKIKSLIRNKKIIMKLVYGQYDRIIRAETGQKFIRGIEQYASLTILPAGHQLLNEKNIELLVSLLEV